ncbi:MAG: TerC family protein [Pseudohongiellaceae bacterium]|nr:TerC family protein [Pseudohongiellaceae bacterium]
MEFLLDPSIWVALLTLILLEVVLGIDNLVFIAILANKLPPHQRDQARVLGLGLAVVMRLGLLSVVSFLVTLTTPLFSVFGHPFSGRDLILLGGGLFLLFKGTTELHERLEGSMHSEIESNKVYAGFWLVVSQIVVLDAVFSLDAVITAVGMVDNLSIMMAAVIISVSLMLFASKPLTDFVGKHPTIVVLCLSFLLMIGLSLIAEGLGFHIPKGYLYAAIGFSVTIEFFNQVANRNRKKNEARLPLRERTATAVLSLLGGRSSGSSEQVDANASPEEGATFHLAERNMVTGVLTLAERSIRSLMTPRTDISWINLDDDPDSIRAMLIGTPHSFFPVCRGGLDEIIGIARAKDLINDLAVNDKITINDSLRKPIFVPDSIAVLPLIETLRESKGQLVLVVDEYGAIQGLITPIDVFEAIAGEFPDEDEAPAIETIDDNEWLVAGHADLHELARVLDSSVFDEDVDKYSTLAGFLMSKFDQLPEVGARLEMGGYTFSVKEVEEQRIAQIEVSRLIQQELYIG